MISFVKFVAVCSAGFLATTALAAKTDDSSATPKPDGKDAKKPDAGKDKGKP